jgi:hypothetical protein
MKQHQNYKFSVTIQSDDYPLVACIRGLAWYCQQSGNKQIAWGGTKRRDWEGDHKVKFHFDHKEYRTEFIREAERLFRTGWSVARQSDNDPAEPQTLE